jgi:hypothetical protein
MLVYFMDIWPILRPFGMFYGQLLYFVAVWNIFPRFGTFVPKKSGNPGESSIFNS